MGRNTVIKATIDIGAEIQDFQQKLKAIEGELNKLNLGKSLKGEFESLFESFASEVKNIQNKTQGNKLLSIDEKSVARSFDRIGQLFDQMTSKISSNRVTSKWLENDQRVYDSLNKLAKDYSKEIKSADSEVSKINRSIKQQEAEQNRINQQLEEQKSIYTNIQKNYGENKTDKEVLDIISQQTQELEEQLAVQKALTNAKAENLRNAKKNKHTQTADEYKASFRDEHDGSARGWNAAYAKKLKEGTLPQVADIEKVTSAQKAYNDAKLEEDKITEQINQHRKDTAAFNKSIEQISSLSNLAKKASNKVEQLNNNLKDAKADAFKKVAEQIQAIKDVDWSRFGIEPDKIQSIEDLNSALWKIEKVGGPEAEKVLKSINTVLDQAKVSSGKAVDGFQQTGEALDGLTERQKQLDQMRNNILQFFSIGNAVNLFKRAIRSAVETVKDLDKVMTETAVVTEFSVSDMWSQLPEYTKRANELGVSIHDVYEASTLYYQQGLHTNEVMAVTNATLRMARIAGLDAAEATDRVTNALRGFNMEINEANADNIADVYSKLAAISASDVDEISTAMTKVASLASSANMQFENTAAFLAQIIETTRESAETAGTALKTVVARFSEVKELYSKGELLGTDEEGEEVDVNKVSKALRTAGINLNEFLVGNKGLDEIFIELASKWDDLDIVQQRYIATMAAGSRQQSRFIALMSDYARTQELTKAAQDANGAATEQYNKTLESLETKITKLKNAWNEFLMSIANSSIIKGTVDALTGLIGIINKIVNAISGGKGLLKSVAAIGISVGSLKFGRKVFNGLLGNPLTGAKSYITEFMTGLNQPKLIGQAGEKAGFEFFKGFKSLKAIDSNAFWKNMLHPSEQFTASELGLNEIDFRDTRLNFSNVEIPQTVKDSLVKQLDSILPNKVDPELKKSYDDLYASINAGNFEQARKQAADLNLELKMNSEQLDATGQRFRATGEQVKAFGQTIQMAGGLLIGLATFMEKIFPNAPKVVTKTIRNVGIALMAIPSVLKIVQVAVGVFSKTVSAEIMSIPILGWIAAIITALVTLATVLSEVIETPAEAAENARQALESAIEAANQAAEAVDNLSSSYDSLIEKANKLEDLTKGTLKWKEAVAENNKQVLELLQTYKELQIESKDGVLTITNYEEVLDQYQKRAANLQIGTIGASVRSIKADLDESVANARSNYAVSYKTVREESREKDKNNLEDEDYEWKSIGDDLYKSIALKVANGDLLDADAVEAEINKYVSGVEFISVSDKTVEALRSLGDEINATTKKLNAQYTAIGATATQYVEVTDAQSKYINSLAGNEEVIDDLYNEFRDGLTHNRYENESEEVQKLYRQYVEETYGVSSGNINGKGNFKKDGELIRYKDKKDEFTSWVVATQQFNKQIEASAIKLEELSTSKNAFDRIIAKSYEGSNGDQLTRLDLTTLFSDEDLENLDLGDLQNKNSALYKKLSVIWNSFDDTTQEAFGNNFEKWAKQTATNIITANNTITKAYSTFDNEDFKKATEKFNASTIDMITKQLATYRPDDNGSFGKTIIDKLSDLLNTEASGDIETLEKAISAFSGVALNSEEDLEGFKDTLASLGINVADDQFKKFIDDITDGMEILSNIDIDKLATSVESLTQIASDINDQSQNRIFSNDAYGKLEEAGIDMSEFVSRSDGSYLYIGDKLDNIVAAIDKQTDDLLGKGREQLEAKQAAFDLTATARDEGLSGKEYLKEVIKNYKEEGLNIGQLGIDGLYGNLSNDKIDILDNEVVESWVAQIKTIAAEQLFWQQELENLNKVEGNSQLMKKNIHQLNSEFSNGGIDIKTLPRDIQEVYYNYGNFTNPPELSDEEKEKYRAAILSKASNVIPIDILDQYINKEWTEETSNDLTALTDLYSGLEEKGLESDQVSKLAQTLQLSMGGTLSAATSKAIELLGAMDTKEVKQEDVEAFAQKIAETTETDMASAMRIAIDTLSMNGEGIIPQEVMDELKSNFNTDTFNSLLSSYQNAQDSELDTQKVQELTNYLQDTKKLSVEVATAVAVANMKYNKSLDTIISSYEDINDLIEHGPLGKGKKLVFTDSKQFEQFNQLKKDLTQALDLGIDLSDSFFESGENIENLTKLVNGSVEEQKAAFGELQKAAAIDIITNTDMADADIQNFIAEVDAIQMPDLEVGAIIHDEQFINVLNSLMEKAGDAGEEIAAALGVKQEVVQVGTRSMAFFDQGAMLDNRNPVYYQEVPVYEMKWVSTGKGGLNFQNLGGGGGRNAKDSGSGSGSGSKESKPKLWKNPYDELYNLQEKVNDALREREQLEHRYEDMLKDHTKTSADLVENTYAEVAALKQQLQLNKQLLAGRKSQMSRVGNEMFEDSEGNRTTLAATGATKYAYYDETTGVVQIDYDAIDKITDENLGNAVEQYISRLEEIRDQINDTEDTIEDINDQLFDIQDRGKEEYLGFEQKVYDAIVNQRQKEIETLEKINDTVTDATNKTISTIQDEISKERQARENDKAEQNIMDKEMRLAYLQRDTSGANDLEIQKLQEEIANDQQSYQDKIIDQTIQEMQDEAERAAEQRQAQIDLLNWQLEVDQKTGAIWGTVSELLAKAFKQDGSLDTDSSLYKLLYNNESAMSQFGKEKWKIDLAKEIAIAMQGRQNWELSTAKDNGSLTLGDGTELKYDKKREAWYDAKNKRFLTDNDLVWDPNTLSYTLPPVTKGTSTTKPQTKTNEETKNDNTPETISYTVQKNDGPWQVAQAVYGSAAEANAQWQDVQSQLQAQGINELHPGQVVKIKRRYAQGGLADFTGPAWLDGTKSRPEMVLNAADTQNFITLKNILAQILNNTQNGSKPISGGDNYFDIDIQAEIDSDYDVDRLADRIKQQIAEDASYRNVNMISQMR